MTLLQMWPQVDAPFAEALLELGRRREDVVVLSADLSKYTDVLPFAQEFPDRFFQVGMAEANMMGIAGGLAKTGHLPVAVTYGVFATRRAYDQVAMALATGPSRGIVVAFLPGITTPFKATHQAIDDLALMRALAGMTVVDPADATEVAAALEFAVAADGPVYIRGLRGTVAQLFDGDGFALRARVVADGGEVGIIATGLATQWALEAAELLEGAASILHVPVVKPLPTESVVEFASRFERRHDDREPLHRRRSRLGGRRGARRGRSRGTRLQRLGVPDRWAPGRIARPHPARARARRGGHRGGRPVTAVADTRRSPSARMRSGAPCSRCAAGAARAMRGRASGSPTSWRACTSPSCVTGSTTSCSRPGTARSPCSPRCTSAGVYDLDELRTYGMDGSRIEESPLEGTPGSRSPAARSVRASRRPSAWRSASGCAAAAAACTASSRTASFRRGRCGRRSCRQGTTASTTSW